MKFNSSRRKILVFSTLSLLAAGIGGAVFQWKNKDSRNLVVAILNLRLGNLNFSERESFDKFANEYVQRKKQFENKLSILSTLAPLLAIISPYALLPPGHSLRRLENNIISNFLMSTDFFLYDAKTERTINYLGFYDPYMRPCTNYLASNMGR